MPKGSPHDLPRVRPGGRSSPRVEDRRIKLGRTLPSTLPNVFGALRRLSGSTAYLYHDGNRCWYSTQPTVTKLAEDCRTQLAREPERIAHEIEKRLRANLAERGDFRRIHAIPASSNDVPDDSDVRLVVLGIDHPYSKEPGNQAEAAAKSILENRGNSPRLYRNSLVFLAADKARLHDLDEAVRNYLAWDSILKEKVELNLDPHQVTQAENQLRSADSTVNARVPEAYQWILVPTQPSPSDSVTWQALKAAGSEGLAARAARKLKPDHLITNLGGMILKMELDKIPLWRGNSVEVRQLAEDFARYIYLPRLADSSVLMGAVANGVASLSWQVETFAFAEGYDEKNQRFRGLQAGRNLALTDLDGAGLLVKADVAWKQIESERELVGLPQQPGSDTTTQPAEGSAISAPPPGSEVQPAAPVQPKRYYGAVHLDPARVGGDASQIAEEVIAHLNALVGAEVTVTLDIQARVPAGVPDNIVRTVTENSRTLKFSSHGFEKS